MILVSKLLTAGQGLLMTVLQLADWGWKPEFDLAS